MPGTEVACPHYPPSSTTTGPQYVCRGCGSLVADQRHPQNQGLGMQAATFLARPEKRSDTRKADRRA